ncbi:MAG: PGF-pre-PGF domain-containing protein [Candidatus Nanohalobium sp.]
MLFLAASGSAKVYLPQTFGNDYPLVFHWEQSDSVDAHIASRTGSNSFSDVSKFEKPYSIGPPGDYDGDNKIEYAVRSQNTDNNGNYLRFYDRNGNQDFSLNIKPKSGSMLSSGYLDKDGKTDLLFLNQNGYMSAVDSDGESKEYTISSFGDPIDVADIDTDGEEEIVYSDSSANVKYYNIGSQTSNNIDPGNDKADSYSNLADVDKDGKLEYAYSTGSSTVYTADINGQDQQVGSLSSAKVTPEAIYYTGTRMKFFVAGNSNNVEVCTLSNCNGASRKSSGARSVIPPITKKPATNASNGKIKQGKTISVKFNVTDWEGYSDIENATARANFTNPDESNYKVVNGSEITSSSGIPGSTSNGNFVPDNGTSKAFEATYRIPQNAKTGTWNVTVRVKDEKMTGTKNWTTFQVEKALVEKNVSQSISMGRKDTSRQTSLGKSQVTGLSFASTGLTESFTNRLLSESLGFSSGKDRNQSLDKNLVTGMAFSRSGSNFKSTFPVLSSSIVTGSTVSDIYSTAVKLTSDFDLSDSPSGTAIFYGSVTETFGLDISQGKGIVQRALELILGVSPSEGRSTDVDRLSNTNLDVGSSTPTGLALARSFNSGLTFAPQIQIQQNILRLFGLDVRLESSQFRDQSLQRSENNTITGSFSSSRFVSVGRLLSETFSQSLGFSRTDSFFFRDSTQGISASGSFEGLTGRTLSYTIGVASDPIRSGAELTRMLFSDLIAGNSASKGSSFFRGSNQSLNAMSGFSSTGMFFGSATQALSIGQSFMGSPNIFRSLTEMLVVGDGRNSKTLFGRTEAQGIDSSARFSRSNSVSRIFNTGISTTPTFQVFDGVIVLLDQMIGVGGQQGDVMESSRSQETSIGASTGISTSQMVFRSFTQPIVASAGPPFLDLGFIDNLVNDVTCRIFGQESRFCESSDGQNNQGSSTGGASGSSGSSGGGIGGIDTGASSKNESKNGKPSGKKGDEKVSKDENNPSEDVKRIEASLKPPEERNKVEKIEKSLENLDKGQKVVVETTENPAESSSQSSGSSIEEDADMLGVEKLSFEAGEAENQTELEVKTVESSGKLNLSTENNKIYEATRVSTEIDTANATLVYEVGKEFLSRNNASKDELVVSRWENSTKIQELSTEIVNESSNNIIVKAYSPRGFCTFTVGLEQQTIEELAGDSDKILTLPKIPVTNALKLLLFVSSLYLLRKPLIVYLSTLDIRLKYLVENARYRLFKYYRRFIWKRRSDVGVEELELTEDVSSLENQKEALKFRKNKLQKEVERKKELRDKYRRSLSLLSEKVEKWEEKL